MEDMPGNKRYRTRQLNKYKVSKERKTSHKEIYTFVKAIKSKNYKELCNIRAELLFLKNKKEPKLY